MGGKHSLRAADRRADEQEARFGDLAPNGAGRLQDLSITLIGKVLAEKEDRRSRDPVLAAEALRIGSIRQDGAHPDHVDPSIVHSQAGQEAFLGLGEGEQSVGRAVEVEVDTIPPAPPSGMVDRG